MAFASTGFLIFLLVGVIVYYLIPKKFQWIWLLNHPSLFNVISSSQIPPRKVVIVVVIINPSVFTPEHI